MRRCLILIVVALACAVAGCGSSSSSSSSPLATELSYLPAGSPLVMTVATDPNGAGVHGVQALLGRFPFASLGIAALKSKLQQSGVNYDGDVRPLLGNPIALSFRGAPVRTKLGTDALVVWVTKDADKLKTLVKRVVPGAHQTGSHAGAAIYSNRGAGAVAIDGPTLIIGTSTAIVTSALDRHAHGGGVTSAQYDHALASLPQDAIVKGFGDLSSVLAQPSAAKARRVPWVAAIRGYAETIGAGSSGLTISFHVDTTGAPLTASQLPFAQGTTAPNFAGALPITVGIHDPAQIASFVQTAEQATSPLSYATFLKREARLRAKTGVNLSSLIKLMTGELIIASDTHTTMGRVTVSDPAAATTILDKLSNAPGSGLGGGSLRKVGTRWTILGKHGAPVSIALVHDQLVIGRASPQQLSSFALAPTTPAAGAHGTVAFRVGLTQLLALALRSAPPQIVQSILSQLSDITGYSSVSPSGLTGSATIAVK